MASGADISSAASSDLASSRAAVTSHAGMPGAVRYQRLDEGRGLGALCSGSFGRIYVALDQVTNETVAVKRQPTPSDAAARELAFYKAISQCRHPHVMSLLDHFVVQGRAFEDAHLYMVFELMDTSLWHLWLNRRRMILLTLAQRFLRQVADGVMHLHSLNIVHTDLSMANMLIVRRRPNGYEPSGDVLRITDMGGAACAHAAVLNRGEVITTAYCRAPEIFLGAMSYTPAVDLWAVGVAGLALLCGELLFWRSPRFTDAHEGFEALPTAATSQEGCWKSVLSNVVAVLGPVSDTWPFCRQLPQWPRAEAVLRGVARYDSLGAALSDPSLVRRTADPHGHAVRLLGSWLRWRPEDRLAAKDSLQADLDGLDTPSAPPMLAAALRAASPTRLRSAVLESWLSGEPVDLGGLGDAAERAQGEAVGPTATSHDGTAGASQGGWCVVPAGQTNGPTATSPASAAATSPGSTAVSGHGGSRVCACSGNCGRHACMSVKRARMTAAAATSQGSTSVKRPRSRATACIMPVAPGEIYCVFGASASSAVQEGSSVMGEGVGVPSAPKNTWTMLAWGYANKHGTWALGKNWTESLQCTARAAFLTNLIPTRDTVAWRSFVKEQEAHLSQRQSATTVAATVAATDQGERCGYLTFAIIVAMAKWPSLVEVALPLLAEMGIQPHTATSHDWRNYIVAMLCHADGRSPREELRGANPGRAAACSGLIWMAKTLRVAQRLEAKKVPRRLSAKSTPGDKVFRLGALQQSYVLLPECEGVQKLQEMMDAIAGTTLELRPKTVVERGTLEDWIRQINALSLRVCGLSAKYSSGSLARRLLSVFEYRYGEAFWDKCRTVGLLDALPDIGRHMPDGATSQPVVWIRKRFGMSILVISAMVCMWEQVDSDCRQAVLRANCLDLLRAMEACGYENPQPADWAPCLTRS